MGPVEERREPSALSAAMEMSHFVRHPTSTCEVGLVPDSCAGPVPFRFCITRRGTESRKRPAHWEAVRFAHESSGHPAPPSIESKGERRGTKCRGAVKICATALDGDQAFALR